MYGISPHSAGLGYLLGPLPKKHQNATKITLFSLVPFDTVSQFRLPKICHHIPCSALYTLPHAQGDQG